jgi:hypothetical protein
MIHRFAVSAWSDAPCFDSTKGAQNTGNCAEGCSHPCPDCTAFLGIHSDRKHGKKRKRPRLWRASALAVEVYIWTFAAGHPRPDHCARWISFGLLTAPRDGSATPRVVTGAFVSVPCSSPSEPEISKRKIPTLPFGRVGIFFSLREGFGHFQGVLLIWSGAGWSL